MSGMRYEEGDISLIVDTIQQLWADAKSYCAQNVSHQATIKRLEIERDEARAFIIAEYNKFHDYHPWTHELRARYPWLAALAAEMKEGRER